jgi:hypothetical protein
MFGKTERVEGLASYNPTNINRNSLHECKIFLQDKELMTHPLVDQFRFTRSEWLRGLDGVTEEQGTLHFGQMNCISWIVGHLA